MYAKAVNKAQQLKYILECRNSGLTDYQWCNEHGINPGTFYNWVSKLKKLGYQNIPDPVSRLNHKAVKQEIVRLDIPSDDVMVDNLPGKVDQNTSFKYESSRDSLIEFILPNATIRFVNNTDPILFNQLIKYLGGHVC